MEHDAHGKAQCIERLYPENHQKSGLKENRVQHGKKRNPQMAVSYSELENVLCVSEGVEDQIDARELAEEISSFLRNRDHAKRVAFIRK